MIIIIPIIYLAIGIWMAIFWRWINKKPVEARGWLAIILFWVPIICILIFGAPFALWDWLENKKL